MDKKKEPRFARFVARPDCGGGMVGINHGLFEEGFVYEVTELFDGEYMIRKLGPSPLGMPTKEARARGLGFSNDFNYDRLYTEQGGNIVRTVAEHLAPPDNAAALAAARAAPRGVTVRVDFGDERSWAEHIEGDVYRSLNNTLSGATLKLPDGHKDAALNGRLVNMRWGHLFEAEVIADGSVRPLFIVGMDDTPLKDQKP